METGDLFLLLGIAHFLAWHVHKEGSALLVDLTSGLVQVFQELHKVFGDLVRVEAGMAADGRAGRLTLLGLCYII